MVFHIVIPRKEEDRYLIGSRRAAPAISAIYVRTSGITLPMQTAAGPFLLNLSYEASIDFADFGNFLLIKAIRAPPPNQPMP